jgi:hypothetical protein
MINHYTDKYPTAYPQFLSVDPVGLLYREAGTHRMLYRDRVFDMVDALLVMTETTHPLIKEIQA